MTNNNYFKGCGTYPFKKESARLIILSTTDKTVVESLADFFFKKEIFYLNNYSIIAVKENVTDDFYDACSMIMIETGIRFKVHVGFVINKNTDTVFVKNYLDIVLKFLKETLESYTTLSSPILKCTKSESINKQYIELFNQMLKDTELGNPFTKDLILTYFKNDLNVLKTASEFNMVRSSILFKFKTIYKTTGLNLLKFKDACCLYILFK